MAALRQYSAVLASACYRGSKPLQVRVARVAYGTGLQGKVVMALGPTVMRRDFRPQEGMRCVTLRHATGPLEVWACCKGLRFQALRPNLYTVGPKVSIIKLLMSSEH